MNKVLAFPNEKSKKATALRKAEEKKVLISLSIVSLILMFVFTNEHLTKQVRPIYIVSDNMSQQDTNRVVASGSSENIQWEHLLAQRLGELQRKPAALGEQATLIDQLRYGQLAGKYRLTQVLSQSQKNPKIMEIEFVDSLEAGDRPVYLKDRKVFLSEYKDLLGVNYEELSLDKKTAESEVYKLFDQGGRHVGQAAFTLDESGHFLSLKVQEIK